MQERYNRRWAIEHGAALTERDPRFSAEWIEEWLDDGTLAGAAFGGFTRLPKLGLYRILEAFGQPDAAAAGGSLGAPTSGSSAIRSIG